MVRLVFNLLTLAMLLFIAVASFHTTGDNAAVFRGNAWQRLYAWRNVELFSSLRDMAVNLLLYLPLGFLWHYRLEASGVHRIGLRPWLWGFFISLLVETLQAFLDRYSDPTDLITNTTGYILGFLLAGIAIRRFRLTPARLLGIHRPGQLVYSLAGLRFLYASIMVFVSLLPFDLSVRLSELYAKLNPPPGQPPRILLDPLYHFREAAPPLLDLTFQFLAFLPIAGLSYAIAVIQHQNSFRGTLIPVLLIACGIELAQVFVASASSDILTPLLALAAALLTLLVGAVFATPQLRERSDWAIAAFFCYLVLLGVLAWSPFRFETNPNALLDKLQQVNLIPFRNHFANPSVSAAIDLAKEFFLAVPLGILFALMLPRQPRWFVSLWLGLGLFGPLELSQVAVIGRYPDLTDVLLGCAGCMAGSWVAANFLALQQGDRAIREPGD